MTVEPLQFVFDAIMPHRPYKYTWTLQGAMDFLQSENGEHSRPDRVRAFEPRIDAAAAILRELGNAPD